MTNTQTPDNSLSFGFDPDVLRMWFDRVADESNWKNPIRRLLPPRADTQAVKAAIIFFTGSVPNIERQPDGSYLVTAAGYYAAVGA